MICCYSEVIKTLDSREFRVSLCIAPPASRCADLSMCQEVCMLTFFKLAICRGLCLLLDDRYYIGCGPRVGRSEDGRDCAPLLYGL